MFSEAGLVATNTCLRADVPRGPEGVDTIASVAGLSLDDIRFVVAGPRVRASPGSHEARCGAAGPLSPWKRIAASEQVAGFSIVFKPNVASMAAFTCSNRIAASSGTCGPGAPVSISAETSADSAGFLFVWKAGAVSIVVEKICAEAASLFSSETVATGSRAGAPLGPAGPVGARLFSGWIVTRFVAVSIAAAATIDSWIPAVASSDSGLTVLAADGGTFIPGTPVEPATGRSWRRRRTGCWRKSRSRSDDSINVADNWLWLFDDSVNIVDYFLWLAHSIHCPCSVVIAIIIVPPISCVNLRRGRSS